jgi:hypothetical protein
VRLPCTLFVEQSRYLESLESRVEILGILGRRIIILSVFYQRDAVTLLSRSILDVLNRVYIPLRRDPSSQTIASYRFVSS